MNQKTKYKATSFTFRKTAVRTLVETMSKTVRVLVDDVCNILKVPTRNVDSIPQDFKLTIDAIFDDGQQKATFITLEACYLLANHAFKNPKTKPFLLQLEHVEIPRLQREFDFDSENQTTQINSNQEENSMQNAITPAVSKPLFSFNIEEKEMNGESVRLINARDLHAQLQVGRDYSTWIKNRTNECNFVENQDFIIDSPNLGNQKGRGGDRRTIEYWITFDVAKHLAMLEKNEIGHQARQYFIDVEKQYKVAIAQPVASNFKVPQTFAEALLLAGQLEQERALLAEKVETQNLVIESQKPAVEFTEAVKNQDEDCLYSIGDVAKLARNLGIETGQNRMFDTLRDLGYIMKNSRMPYQKYLDKGLFIAKMFEHEQKDGTMKVEITPKFTGAGVVEVLTRLAMIHAKQIPMDFFRIALKN